MFDEAFVRERIAPTRFPRLLYTRETDSTNDDALNLLADRRAAGAVILAEYQRLGRGRRGRRWVAPAGSALLFTAIVPRAVPTAALWAVPFWCALAVADGVAASAGIALSQQWPNDLLLDGRKACGILSTSRVVGDEAWVGTGVGLNVLRPPADTGAVDPAAAYLSDAARDVSREDVLIAIVRALDARLGMLDEPAAIASEWERRAGLPGAAYRLFVDGETAAFDAVALRLSPDGGLVVANRGSERRIALADARVLRDRR
jgi:BirA family biotin operon repressor/biotin-[acetyl-CoA-carboxylase] ligase